MKTKEKIYLISILALVLALNCYYLSLKSGYYVDEGMTMVLANGTYNGTVTSKSEYGIGDFLSAYVFKSGDNLLDVISNVKGMLNDLSHSGNYSKQGTVEWYDAARSMLQGKSQWMTGRELRDQIVAEKGSRFQYKQVYINQALDVHPIFYYVLVHTIFSIFPDTYSNAFLFCINIIFLLLSLIVLYKIVKNYWKDDENTALIAVILWGFSQGFASCAVYFRMYAVLTFFILMTLYVHLMIITDWEGFNDYKSRWIVLAISVWLGFNTQYYFILFMAPLFVITCIVMWKQKKILKRYIKCMITTAVISSLVWPFSVYHILFGYRGTEAMANVLSTGIVDKLIKCVDVFDIALIGGVTGGMLVAIATVIAYFVLYRKQIVKNRGIYLVSTIPGIIYLILVAQIAPTVSDRYLMCIFPLMIGLLSVSLSGVIRYVIKNRRYGNVLLVVCCLIIVIFNIVLEKPNYLYLEQKDNVMYLQGDKADYNCLMIGYDHGQGFSEILKLSEYANVLVVGQQEMDMVSPLYDSQMDKMVIYVFDGLDVEEVLKQAENKLEISGNIFQINSDIESFSAFVYE